jgi:hypothetical protein
MLVRDLLESKRGCGRQGALSTLLLFGMSEALSVELLTERQRGLLGTVDDLPDLTDT